MFGLYRRIVCIVHHALHAADGYKGVATFFVHLPFVVLSLAISYTVHWPAMSISFQTEQ